MSLPAARSTDMHVCPAWNAPVSPHTGGPIAAGCPTVLIGNMPAARLSDATTCAGPPGTVTSGSPVVLIGGPAPPPPPPPPPEPEPEPPEEEEE